ncbi:unnamed protein product [Rotaria sordida]|uniref:Transposase n=1 Tax=Rotaria sordida TaxID=392033 RepID=A0A820ASL5_9BILA|nr:unnamed protein product [Rotaria sordida]CAF4187879.1 unnamed protein product [Rotaria sordida]
MPIEIENKLNKDVNDNGTNDDDKEEHDDNKKQKKDDDDKHFKEIYSIAVGPITWGKTKLGGDVIYGRNYLGNNGVDHNHPTDLLSVKKHRLVNDLKRKVEDLTVNIPAAVDQGIANVGLNDEDMVNFPRPKTMVDGTFASVPTGFEQLVVIMGTINDEGVPLAWALTSNRKQPMYDKIWSEIISWS